MKKYTILFYCFFLLQAQMLFSQQIAIGFYNCENLYDTTKDKNVFDQPFTPNGEKKYNTEKYQTKISHTAYVFNQLNHLQWNTPLAMMGLAEIENKNVLNAIIKDSLLQSMHLQYIHYDSKDARGIDVALIYNTSLFSPYQSKNFSIFDASNFNKYQTRDLLWVKGKLMGHWVSIIVNHWPSRRNNQPGANKDRIWAATRCRQIMDSLILIDPQTPFFVMGDFNDNPTDISIATLQLQNPFLPLFKAGRGSLVFANHWFLFDQILYTRPQANTDFDLNNCKSIIYKDAILITGTGIRRGGPFASFVGNQFQGGFSDHLPVALIFTLKNAKNALK